MQTLSWITSCKVPLHVEIKEYKEYLFCFENQTVSIMETTFNQSMVLTFGQYFALVVARDIKEAKVTLSNYATCLINECLIIKDERKSKWKTKVM